MRGDAGSIPLQCTICPKKPKFSDLSHLLTHISSKSHLAHRFRAELRARDDRIALEEVRQYDSWCERYGINALLAERMAAKERKKGGGRRGRPVSGDVSAPPVMKGASPRLTRVNDAEQGQHPSGLRWLCQDRA
jgi:hypothetical protein